MSISSLAYESKKIKNSYTPLMNVISQRNYVAVHALLDAGADINIISHYGDTAIIHAIHDLNGHEEQHDIILKMINNGLDLNAKRHISNESQTALIYAAERNNFEAIQLLVKAGADLNIQDSLGCTALLKSTYNSHFDVVQFLIQAGADINLQNCCGNTIFNCPMFGEQKQKTKDFIKSYQENLQMKALMGHENSEENSFLL